MSEATDSSDIDPAQFRQVLGSYPTGVCAITATGADGAPVGMVVGKQALTEGFFPVAVGIFAFAWFYLFGIGTLRPYTTFESRASDRSDKIWSWFLGGTGTFLLFGTLLTFLRRPLLGF